MIEIILIISTDLLAAFTMIAAYVMFWELDACTRQRMLKPWARIIEAVEDAEEESSE